MTSTGRSGSSASSSRAVLSPSEPSITRSITMTSGLVQLGHGPRLARGARLGDDRVAVVLERGPHDATGTGCRRQRARWMSDACSLRLPLHGRTVPLAAGEP